MMHHHPLNASSPDSPSAPFSRSSALRSKTPSRPDLLRSWNILILHMRAVRFSWAWRFLRIRGGGERGSGESKQTVSMFDRLVDSEKQDTVDVVVVGGGVTNAWELGATVTALWRATLLFGVLVLEFSAGGFDDADFVGAGVVSDSNASAISLEAVGRPRQACSWRLTDFSVAAD